MYSRHSELLMHDQGFYTKDRPNKKLDVVVVEASAITEDGGIIPGASVGASPELIQMADKVGLEILVWFSTKCQMLRVAS
jgi:acyl-CoA hydrolase